MYATLFSVRTRGIPIASNSRYAIVPVASWVSVWSILRATSSPGIISPLTRCSLIIFCAIVSPIFKHSSYSFTVFSMFSFAFLICSTVSLSALSVSPAKIASSISLCSFVDWNALSGFETEAFLYFITFL